MGLTPLMAAARTGSYDAIKTLLTHGANVNYQHFVSKRTAFMEACTRTNVGVVRELLRYGAYLHVKDKDGSTARMGIRERTVRFIHDLACEHWSPENSFLFPNDFRAVGLTLGLISLRQRNEHNMRMQAVIKQSKEDMAAIEDALVQNKSKYENASRETRVEATIVRQCMAVFECDTKFDFVQPKGLANAYIFWTLRKVEVP